MKKVKNLRKMLSAVAFSLVLASCGAGVYAGSTAASDNPVEALRAAESSWLLEEMDHPVYSNFEYLLSYTPSASLNQLLGAFLGMPIPSVEISAISSLGDIWTTLVDITLDGDTIPLELVANSSDSSFTLALPNISNYFIEFIGGDIDYTLQYFIQSFSDVNTEEMFELSQEFVDMYIAHVENYAQITTGYALSLLGLEFETIKFEIPITEEFVADLIELSFSTLNLILIANDLSVDDILEEIRYELTDFDMSMNVWLSGSDIVKRTLTITDSEYDVRASIINVLEGNERTVQIEVVIDGFGNNYSGSMVVLAELIRENGSYSGPITTTIDDVSFYIEVENFSVSNGFIYGTVLINENIEEVSVDLAITFSRENLMQLISLTGNVGLFGLSADIGELILGFGLTPEVVSPSERQDAFAIRIEDYEMEEVYELRLLSFLRDIESFVASSTGILREALPTLGWLIEDLEFSIN